MKLVPVTNTLGYPLCGMELKVSNETMTEKPTKKRAPKNTKPLGAGEAFDLIMERRETRAESRSHRLAECAREFDRVEQVYEEHTRNRVPEAQRARLDKMLAADVDPAPTPSVPSRLLETPPAASPIIETDHTTGKSRRLGAERA